MVSYEAQRIDLEGVSNARQLGGYVTADGKRVKKNVVLRTYIVSKGRTVLLTTIFLKIKVFYIVG